MGRERIESMEKLFVQYGCGWSAPEKWINFDASPTLRYERIPLFGHLIKKNKSRFPNNVKYGDIIIGLPISENSCDGIYCSHVLEHLSLEDCRKALKNTYKILKSGGVFRLVMPDLEFYIQQYMKDISPEAATRFMKGTILGRVHRNNGLKAFFFEWLGSSQHLWLWDYKAIELELSNVGFKNIRLANMGDSQDLMFMDVETSDRWINCLGVQAIKD